MIKLTLSIAVLLFGASAIDQQHGIKQLALTKGKLASGHNSAKNLAKIRASAGSKLKSKLTTGVVRPCEPHPDCEVNGEDVVVVVEQLASDIIEHGILVGQDPSELREEVYDVIADTIGNIEDLELGDDVVEQLEENLHNNFDAPEDDESSWSAEAVQETLETDIAVNQEIIYQEKKEEVLETVELIADVAQDFKEEVQETVEYLEENGASKEQIEQAVAEIVLEKTEEVAETHTPEQVQEVFDVIESIGDAYIVGDVEVEELDLSVSVESQVETIVEDALTGLIEDELEGSADELSEAIEVIEQEHLEITELAVEQLTVAEDKIAEIILDGILSGEVVVETNEDGTTEVIATEEFHQQIQDSIEGFVEHLEEAGIPEEQAAQIGENFVGTAETLVDTLVEAVDEDESLLEELESGVEDLSLSEVLEETGLGEVVDDLIEDLSDESLAEEIIDEVKVLEDEAINTVEQLTTEIEVAAEEEGSLDSESSASSFVPDEAIALPAEEKFLEALDEEFQGETVVTAEDVEKFTEEYFEDLIEDAGLPEDSPVAEQIQQAVEAVGEAVAEALEEGETVSEAVEAGEEVAQEDADEVEEQSEEEPVEFPVDGPVEDFVSELVAKVEDEVAQESEEPTEVVADADDSDFADFVEDFALIIAEAEEEAAKEVGDEHYEDSAEEKSAFEEAKQEIIDEKVAEYIEDARPSDPVHEFTPIELVTAVDAAQELVEQAQEAGVDLDEPEQIQTYIEDNAEDVIEDAVEGVEEATETIASEPSGFLQGIEDGYTRVVASIDGEQFVSEQFVSNGDGLDQKTLTLVIPSCVDGGPEIQVDIDLFENHADGARLRENTCHDGQNFITRE